MSRVLQHRVEKRFQKTALTAANLVNLADLHRLAGLIPLISSIPRLLHSVNLKTVDSPGIEPGRLGVSIQPSKPAEPTVVGTLAEVHLYSKLRWAQGFSTILVITIASLILFILWEVFALSDKLAEDNYKKSLKSNAATVQNTSCPPALQALNDCDDRAVADTLPPGM